MTIKSSITWLTGTLLAIMILISGALMYLLNHSNDAFATTFHDRVIPLKQLKISADMFAVNVVDTIHKTNSGAMSPAQGSQSISVAETEFNKQWQAYTSTRLTADEQKLIDQANGQISQALGVANEAKSLMQAGDMPGLKTLADSKLYPAVDPLSDTISRLAELQLHEAENNFNSSVKDLHASTTFASLAILAGLLIGVIITWRISRRLSRNVGHFQQTCLQIAQKRDLTLRVPTESRDELAQIGQYLNELLGQFALIIGDLRQSSQCIHQQSTQVDAASTHIMNSSKQQNDATATIASTIEQFAVSIAHVAESANLAKQKAGLAGKVSIDSEAALQETLREITAVGNAIRHSEQQVNALARQSQEITSILDVIRDVADQTNLLALNAAIEAARAGEMGRGFAVVADEVRKLAERTAQSTLQIDTMINAVSQSAREATVAMQDSVERVSRGEALTASMQTAINQIRSEVSSVADSANDIADALAEQRQASNGIAHQVEQIATLSEENASNAGALNDYAQNLSRQSQELEAKVRDFTV